MTTNRPVLFCFRNDLRLADNTALTAAIESGKPLALCYILDDATPGQWKMGGASRWWLHHSLAALSNDLSDLDCPLILRRGIWEEAVTQIAQDIDAEAVFFSRAYEPYAAAQEVRLKEKLEGLGIDIKRYGGYLFFEPEQIRTQSGNPYKVFTPFWRNCLQQLNPKLPKNRPKTLTKVSPQPVSENLTDWHFLPTKPNWAGGLERSWQPGEAGAWHRLTRFLDQAASKYKEQRDIPNILGTSQLSAHLHFGEITPRQVWHHAQVTLSARPDLQIGVDAFIRELGWRDFSYHLLHHWPHLPEKPFRQEFAAFPWKNNPGALRDWQKGQTGIPLIDAGMRELWTTGWMHNRVRMIVASFLVKNLLIPWQDGEAWFWDTLVDADLANNAASWQWVAGSGADAAPYFRIFNPVTQSSKFDPDGLYIKKWVPELAKLPPKQLHAPWMADPQVLAGAGITLGKTYPKPAVDLKTSRQRALDAYQSIRT